MCADVDHLVKSSDPSGGVGVTVSIYRGDNDLSEERAMAEPGFRDTLMPKPIFFLPHPTANWAKATVTGFWQQGAMVQLEE